MAMGELLVAASIKFLFEKLATLASSELSNFARGFGGERRIRTLLTKWSKTLEEIEAVLVDADEKRVTERGIKIWLEDLQDLAYDVDDILDEFSTEALRPKSMITTKSLPKRGRQRCQKGKGRYWRFISHIPRVDIDDKFIFDPSC
ncbi:unnamed protein product [Camellia sinensis]